MKLSLVVLAVLVGVAASSPVDKKIDSIIHDLLNKLEKREEATPASTQTQASSGTQGEASEASSDSDEKQEVEAEEKEEEEKEEKAAVHPFLQWLAKHCGITKRHFFTPVSMKDAEKVFEHSFKVFSSLSKKFDSHKDVLEEVEEMGENDESTEKHAKLLKKFAEIPDTDILKQVTCALASIKIFIARGKVAGMDKNDFPNVQNCHRTCRQLNDTYSKIAMGEKPNVDMQKTKLNSLADYKCIKNHVFDVTAMLKNGKDDYSKGRRPSGGEVFAVLALMEHIIEILGTRGFQLHWCAHKLDSIHKEQQDEEVQASASPSRRELEKILSTLKDF